MASVGKALDGLNEILNDIHATLIATRKRITTISARVDLLNERIDLLSERVEKLEREAEQWVDLDKHLKEKPL